MSLNAGNSNKKNLVIGVGNPLRCDDGVGPYVAECIEAKGLTGVSVWITQQLQVEDLERMLEYKRIILVDAAIKGEPLEFRSLHRNGKTIISSSHHLSAEVFINLADSIYHKNLRMDACSIRGICFDVGNKISPDVHSRADEAVELICVSLQKQ